MTKKPLLNTLLADGVPKAVFRHKTVLNKLKRRNYPPFFAILDSLTRVECRNGAPTVGVPYGFSPKMRHEQR